MGIPIRAENDLHRDLVSLAFEASSDCIKMLASDGTLLLLNAGGAEAMEFDSPAVPVGRNWIEFWAGEERETARAAVAAAVGGHSTTFRGFLPTNGGAPRWWESTLRPLASNDGHPCRVLVISRDITERLIAERAQRLSERRYQTLVEATSQVVWSLDLATGRFESRGWQAFTGGPREADDAGSWLAAVHPDDRGNVPLLAVETHSEASVVDASYRLWAAGHWRWVEDRAVPVTDDDGVPTGWIGVVTDVHERKLVERRLCDEGVRLRLALESASLGTWDADLRTGECDLSAEARTMLGLDADDADSDLLTVLHPDDRASVIARHEVHRTSTSGMSLTNFRIVRRDTGETRWIAARGRALLDHDGTATRRVGTFEDFTERKRTNDALHSTLRRHQALLDALSVVMWHSDAAQTTFERQGWTRFTGDAFGAIGVGWIAAVHADDRVRVGAERDQGKTAARSHAAEYRLAHVGGGHRWVREDVVPLVSDDGEVEGWVGVISDIHERRTAELALAASEGRLRLASEVTGLGTYDVDLVTGGRDWSPEFFDLLRVSRTLGPERRLFLSALHPDDRARVIGEWDALDSPDDCPTYDFRLRFGEEDRWMEVRERVFRDTEGRPNRRIGTMQDVTDRKRVERELWMSAHADALTGLANRNLFQTRLEEAVAEADRSGEDACVILIDVDSFKEINDTMGHAAGDAVLRVMAERLERSCPPEATVGRLGGDEFGLVLPRVRFHTAPQDLADEILLSLRRPVVHEGQDVEFSGSLGWAAYPRHDPDASALLKNADMALYAAKRAGRDRVACFEVEMRDDLQRRSNVLRCARDAMARDAVFPHYQPKISLRTGRIVGFEALLRWRNGSSLQPPSAIQEAFADPELACRLGSIMLRSIAADMRVWADAGVQFGHVALNAGAPELHRPDYANGVLAAIAQAGLRPHQLEIEVTEGVLLDDATMAVTKALKVLHEAGVAIALDDFGTGYASLIHLKRFPVTWLKIDRSFVSNMERDGDARTIVDAVVGLAHSLGMRTVAEGIETTSQLDLLTRIGCDLGQGYLVAKPMAADCVPNFVARWNVGPGLL